MQLQNMARLKMAWALPEGRDNGVVLSSRVRLARNLKAYPFPSRAGPKALGAVLDSLFAAARKTAPLAKAAYLKMSDLDPVDRLFLAERHLISRALAQDPDAGGAVVGDREILSCMINEEDHVRLQALDSGLCFRGLWGELDSLDNEISSQVEFAVHPQWGYLCACPTNAGTALRVSALLHLPGLTLTEQINGVLEGLARVGVTARGFYGEGTRVLGDFYQISNAVSLGRSEADFIAGMESTASGLVAREVETRRSIAAGPRKARLEDLVFRSLGILTHARSISYEETLHHLSYLRLAVSMDWDVPVDMVAINELLVLAQPAHVQMSLGKELPAAERDVHRASLLRKKLGAAP